MHVRIARYDIGRRSRTISSSPTTTARRDMLTLLYMFVFLLNLARIDYARKLVYDVSRGCDAVVEGGDREANKVLNGRLYIQTSIAWLNTSTTWNFTFRTAVPPRAHPNSGVGKGEHCVRSPLTMSRLKKPCARSKSASPSSSSSRR
jgi:hypothetical protein